MKKTKLAAEKATAINELKQLAKIAEDRALTVEEEERLSTLETTVGEISKRMDTVEKVISLADDDDEVEEEKACNPRSKPDYLDHAVKHDYSLARAISRLAENRRLDGIEGEINEECNKRNGRNAQGFWYPMGMPGMQKRTISDTSSGSGLQATYWQDFIDILRNKMVCAKAGARFMTGLKGITKIAAETAATTAYWVAESNAPSASYPTISYVSLTPRTLGAYTDISRKLLVESYLNAEELIRDDLSKVVSIALDYAALFGSGQSNQPTGIVNAIDAGNVVSSGTNGGAVTYANLCSMVKLVEAANALLDDPCWVVSPAAKAQMRQVAKIGTTFPFFLMDDNGDINGYRSVVSNQVPANLTKGSGTALTAAIFGCFSELLIGTFTDLDILIDPFSNSTSGTLRVVCLVDADIAIRHTKAFSAIVDMTC